MGIDQDFQGGCKLGGSSEESVNKGTNGLQQHQKGRWALVWNQQWNHGSPHEQAWIILDTCTRGLNILVIESQTQMALISIGRIETVENVGVEKVVWALGTFSLYKLVGNNEISSILLQTSQKGITTTI